MFLFLFIYFKKKGEMYYQANILHDLIEWFWDSYMHFNLDNFTENLLSKKQIFHLKKPTLLLRRMMIDGWYLNCFAK